MNLEVHHVGYAVRSIEKSAPAFMELGYQVCSEVTEDTIRGIKIQFLKNDKGFVIELVEPAQVGSPVDGILKRNGEGPYHICYIVDDINAAICELQDKRYKIFLDKDVAPAIENKNVAFLYHNRMGIIELVER